MDGISLDDEVKLLVVGATNRIDLLDSALLRPGRFDRIVNVDLPDKEGRLQILELVCRNKPLASDVDLDLVAKETFGFSGAHLESLANEAAILAMREDQAEIRGRHFLNAIDKVIMGEKLERRPSREEMRRIAVHEAGHALVGETEFPNSVSSITITSRGNALGYVRQAPQDDMYLHTKEYLEGNMRVLLAGAVAEEALLGSRSTGASTDLSKAIELAKRMVFSGMSRLGAVAEDALPQGAFSRELGRIVREQEKAVEELIRQRQSFLEDVVGILVEKESLSGTEFREMLQARDHPPN